MWESQRRNGQFNQLPQSFTLNTIIFITSLRVQFANLQSFIPKHAVYVQVQQMYEKYVKELFLIFGSFASQIAHNGFLIFQFKHCIVSQPNFGVGGFWSRFLIQVNLLQSRYIINFGIMPERKAWTPQQDKTLKHLRQELQINKWSIIAKKMAEQFDMPGRTGKQCRQRYHNHLDSSILRSEWTREEEQNLYNLHDEIGNKWAIIAQKLPGRTDNCVKNHFYSRMRKAIRKLNKTIHQHFKKDYRQIKMPVLYKIVEATDEKFKSNPSVQEEISQRCCKLKNMLLAYSNDDNNILDGDLEKLRELSNEIHDFSLKYRRKQKKTRRCSAQGEDLLQVPKFEHRNKTSSDGMDDDQDEYSMAFSRSCEEEEEESERKIDEQPISIPKIQLFMVKQEQNREKILPTTIIENEANLLRPPVISLQVPAIQTKNSLNMEQETEKVEQLLKNQGILQKSSRFNSRAAVKKNSTLKREDSYGMMIDEDGKHNNMLGESIDRMKINSDLIYQVEVDEENKLFISN